MYYHDPFTVVDSFLPPAILVCLVVQLVLYLSLIHIFPQRKLRIFLTQILHLQYHKPILLSGFYPSSYLSLIHI